MKLAIILVTTALLQLPAIAQCQTDSFSGKKVPLTKVFEAIREQTGNVFFYDPSLLTDTKPVTVRLKNIPIETALNEIFLGQPITWVLENRIITLLKKPLSIKEAPVVTSAPPSMRVKGIVTDEDGVPISYVSVAVKGIKSGSLTDTNGVYAIQAHKDDVLQFSSASYLSSDKKVTGPEMNITLQQDVKSLEALLIGGNIGAIKRKTDATTVTIIDSKTLERLPVNTLDQVFRGLVPGTITFNLGDNPEGFPNLTIRGWGGSELAVGAIYVDGIEYAGASGYLFQLDKNNIDRIEVVRGPGAATMYGTGSNGGIIQIFTKQPKPGTTLINLTSSAGFYKSKWVKYNPFQQLHNLELQTAYKNLAFTLGGSYRSVNGYLPEGGEKNKIFYAGSTFSHRKLKATGNLRYIGRDFKYSRFPVYDTAIHPRTDILIDSIPAYEWFGVMPIPSTPKAGLTETLVGSINLSHKTTRHWANNLVAGFSKNDYRQRPLLDGISPLPRSLFRYKHDIITVRYFSELSFPTGSNGLSAVITTGAEYKKYSSSTSYVIIPRNSAVLEKDPDNENYGTFVQANPSWKNIHLTVGMRYEINKLFKAAWNPRIGLTTNFAIKSVTVKPKISWGRGLMAPPYAARFGGEPSSFGTIYGNPDIKPQAQQGFDYGVEIYERRGKYQAEITHYDNVVKDIVATVPLAGGDYTFTNKGAVANTGWEFSGSYRGKRFNVMAAYSIMNSTIKDSAAFGGRVPGTRLNYYPRHTAGVNLTYNFFRLFSKADKGALSLTLTESDGLMSYDQVNYALDVAYGRTPYTPGTFGYYIESPAVFRLGLNAEYNITDELRFFIQASNILNDYKYEYLTLYPTYGATWLFGFKFNVSVKNNRD